MGRVVLRRSAAHSATARPSWRSRRRSTPPRAGSCAAGTTGRTGPRHTVIDDHPGVGLRRDLPRRASHHRDRVTGGWPRPTAPTPGPKPAQSSPTLLNGPARDGMIGASARHGRLPEAKSCVQRRRAEAHREKIGSVILGPMPAWDVERLASHLALESRPYTAVPGCRVLSRSASCAVGDNKCR